MIRPVLALVALGFVCGAVGADDRVAGSRLVREGIPVSGIFEELLGYTIDAEEIGLFLHAVDRIEPWARANLEAWQAVNGGGKENVVRRLRSLAVWRTAPVTPEEFFALTVKISSARDLAATDPGRKIDDLRRQRASLERALAGGGVGPDKAAELRQAIGTMDSLIDALGRYPRANLDVYHRRRGEIDAALARLDALDPE